VLKLQCIQQFILVPGVGCICEGEVDPGAALLL